VIKQAPAQREQQAINELDANDVTVRHVELQDARVNLSEMIARVRFMRERFAIRKRGRVVAMVIPVDEGPPEPENLPDRFSANLKELAEQKLKA